MKKNSITFKLLSIIIITLLLAAGNILWLGNTQLTKIINESQQGIYSEKIETILGALQRSAERLRKTGLVEAYVHDFQQESLKTFRQSYYNSDSRQNIYPFIIDVKGNVVIHPVFAQGDQGLAHTEIARQMLSANEGEFNSLYQGQDTWYIFKRFQEWDWIIGYRVPMKIKYADAIKFRNLLIIILSGITVLSALVLSLIVARFIRPIVVLSNIATTIAEEGDLDQQIDTSGTDEVGVLARNFSHMRDSIRQKILNMKEAEEKLVQKNEYINSIIESVTHPLYAIDVNDYTIKIANTASGYNADGKHTCYAQSHKQDTPCRDSEHPCPLEIVKQTKKSTRVEHIHFDQKGNKRYFEIYAYPVFDKQGELVQMIEYNIDVTDRRKAQDALAAEKERLAVTLRSIGDGVITTNISGNVVILNKVAEELTGWSNKDANGRPLVEIFNIINEQTREVCENPATKVVNNGQTIELANHTVLIARDGTERSIADSAAPILDAQSNIVGVVIVFRDVTEQIKTEQELLKVKKLESIGVLAGGIAHDFNNILAAILGNINLSLFDKDLSDRTKHLLSEAEKATLRAKDLTQQLLTFAKGGEPVKEVSSMEAVIKDSAGFVLHGDQVACKYHIPEDLWMVEIDKGQISQVIQNIVLNASHAMPEGGIVNITCENLNNVSKVVSPFLKEGRFVKISIQDSGIGIPPNLIEKVFDPYFSTKQEGSGLGLAITQSIINKHNGHILVESSPGFGSTFTIYLPSSEKIENKFKESTFEEIKESFQAKIMIMDDEEIVRNIAMEMLTALGHEVALAADGEEAIRLFQDAIHTDKNFDLVIMDLTIPGGMGGKEAVKKILAIDSNAKVIVSSGYSNDPIMASCQEYGFSSAIVKPYKLQELSRAINSLLG